MSSIGPQIPSRLLQKNSVSDDGPDSEPPSTEIMNFDNLPGQSHAPLEPQGTDDNEEEADDYAPELPPDLLPKPKASSSSSPLPVSASGRSSSRILGPSMPPGLAPHDDSDDSDDDIGPKPPPTSTAGNHSARDGVAQFRELEERRRKNAEEAARPKTLQREEWMLVPPSASEVLGNIDPTRLKARTFAKSSGPDRSRTDNTLWTETPQQRQQRIADEVSGKKRRAVNAEADPLSQDELSEMRKRQKLDAGIRKGVEEHTKMYRGESLVDVHSKSKKGDDDDPKANLIWDHERDMSLGGRLMDDSQRAKLLKDAKGLGARFGTGQGGGFL